jgi:bifunctional non-homologous end joining protein LigD
MRPVAIEHFSDVLRGLSIGVSSAASGRSLPGPLAIAGNSHPPLLKLNIEHEEEFVIDGYTRPAGSRSHFGAILIGGYRDEKLLYAGHVGTGFSEAQLAALWKVFQPLRRDWPTVADPPRERGLTWIEPKLVAQVRFTEWTHDRHLRHPVFLRLRDDKDAAEVDLPQDAP